jgi:hypothetical protein
MDFDFFNRTSTDRLGPDDVDIVVDPQKRQAWILHVKPFRTQDSIAGISYNTATCQFTIRSKNGSEQVLEDVKVAEPLRADMENVKTITAMWVNNAGNVFDINELPLDLVLAPDAASPAKK